MRDGDTQHVWAETGNAALYNEELVAPLYSVHSKDVALKLIGKPATELVHGPHLTAVTRPAAGYLLGYTMISVISTAIRTMAMNPSVR
jgi:hypothetical protein